MFQPPLVSVERRRQGRSHVPPRRSHLSTGRVAYRLLVASLRYTVRASDKRKRAARFSIADQSSPLSARDRTGLAPLD